MPGFSQTTPSSASRKMTFEGCSAQQELQSINDLKKIPFGQTVPKHSLLLLHWFAKTVNIDQCNNITLTFDPNTQFGSHYYGDHEDVLLPLPTGYHYYTVGNLNVSTSHELPAYIRNPPVKEYQGSNSDRIVFSAKKQNSGVYRINRVYLTQHQGLSSKSYDQANTYQLSTELLQQIGQFSSINPTSLRELKDRFQSDISNTQIMALRNSWGDRLIGLGLMLFIVIKEKYLLTPVNTFNAFNTRQSGSTRDTLPGYGQGNLLDQNSLNSFGSNSNDDNYDKPVNHQPFTCFLAKLVGLVFIFVIYVLVLNVNVLPEKVQIADYDAYLSVVAKQGKACAQLHIKQHFRHWNVFQFPWVGFYKSEKDTRPYIWQWQWVTRFEHYDSYGEYNVFEYCSAMDAVPGVHVRFMTDDFEIARAPSRPSLEIIGTFSKLYTYTKDAMAKLMENVEQRHREP